MDAGQGHRDALARAKVAAAAGDAAGMLEALAESRMLDGLARRLERDWKLLDREDRHAVIGEAVDVLYDAVQRGERVIFVGGYLYKVTLARADKRHKAKLREAATAPDDMAMLTPGEPDEGQLGGEDQAEPAAGVGDGWDESRRAEAITRLRQLVPRCGGPSIQSVLNIILDALERGIPSVGNPELSAATGLNPGNVRKCRMRGLQRLERLAREAAVSAGPLAEMSSAADEEADDEEEVEDDG